MFGTAILLTYIHTYTHTHTHIHHLIPIFRMTHKVSCMIFDTAIPPFFRISERQNHLCICHIGMHVCTHTYVFDTAIPPFFRTSEPKNHLCICHIGMHACMYVCMYVCMHVHIHTFLTRLFHHFSGSRSVKITFASVI
jgi:hypothetical protein